MTARPNVLRVKRKRGQDPLQALVLENSPVAKRSKQNTPVSSRPGTPMRVTPTEESRYYLLALAGATELVDSLVVPVLAEELDVLRKRQFYLLRTQWDDPSVPNELADMVLSFLAVNGPESHPEHKRKTRGHKESTSTAGTVEALSDYVYDTYHLSEPMTSANHPQAQIGYVRFFDEENDLYQSDEENDTTHRVYSDDEDSNAELFYQNDYPSDEDAEGLAEQLGEGGEILVGSLHNVEELGDFHDKDNGLGDTDELYEQFFLGVEGHGDSDSESVERQHFFPGEDDDELAMHRDRIFGRLQRMVEDE